VSLALYVLLHLTLLEFHGFIAFKMGLVALITWAAYAGGYERSAAGLRILTSLAVAVSIFFLDEMLIPDLAKSVRMRFLLPATTAVALILMRYKSPRFVWNMFLSMNVVFLCVYMAYSTSESLEFGTEGYPKNKVYERLESVLSKEVPVTLVLSDGYPSDSILSERFDIRFSLDSQLDGYSYERLQTRYASTPISVANLLFGAVFPLEDTYFGVKGRQSEVELLRKAMDVSGLKGLLAGRRTLWASFVMDEGYSGVLDLPWWRRVGFRAMFDNLALQHFVDGEAEDVKIRRYNRAVLSDYRRALAEPDQGTPFIFLHLLTFHTRGLDMKEEIAYADSLILETAHGTPKGRKLILFSDHGARDDGMTPGEMRSGILLTSPDP
jgi:hypothetical protein